MNKVVLHLGSNIGKRTDNLSIALAHIEESIGRILQQSSIYQTAAWGIEDQADFYNLAVLVQSDYSPLYILNRIAEIESKMGRARIVKWGTRLIDIDIIFYGNRIIQIPRLSIPHPHLQHRNFVLVPLQEIIPDWIHPILKKDIISLVEACNDPLEVQLILNGKD